MANGGWPDATGMFELVPTLDLLTTEYITEDVDVDLESDDEWDEFDYEEEPNP